MTGYRNRIVLLVLQNAPILLFALLLVVFGAMSERFLTPINFVNILNQSTHIAIIAIGMTFVLLIAGIDLSVGANMYVSAAVLGVFLSRLPPLAAFPIVAVLGLAFGIVNAFFITQLRVAAFITTLATLFIGRGVALYFSGNKMVPFNKEILTFGRTAYFSVPSAIWIFAIVFLIALVVLKLTTFGRQVYAIGADPDAAAKGRHQRQAHRLRGLLHLRRLRRHRRPGIGESGSRRLIDLRLPEGISGHRRGGSGRNQPVRRAGRRGRDGLRRRPDSDGGERPRDDQCESISLSAGHKRDHFHRRVHRQFPNHRARAAGTPENPRRAGLKAFGDHLS